MNKNHSNGNLIPEKIESLTMLPQLYIIRHGETEWSLSGQHTGVTDVPLTARGEAEACELAKRLQGILFANVLSSPLQRARRTCELAALHPVVEIEPDLQEWNYGDYEGKLSADIFETQPDWNIFCDGSPNGESPAQVSDRADRLITHLRMLKGPVALFTHGHFGRVLAMRWIGLQVAEGQHFQLGTASLSILGYDSHRSDLSIIVQWNAVSTAGIDLRKKKEIDRWENEGGVISDIPEE